MTICINSCINPYAVTSTLTQPFNEELLMLVAVVEFGYASVTDSISSASHTNPERKYRLTKSNIELVCKLGGIC